jgi:hypothetical protein
VEGYDPTSAAKWLFDKKRPNEGIAKVQDCYFRVRQPYCTHSIMGGRYPANMNPTPGSNTKTRKRISSCLRPGMAQSASENRCHSPLLRAPGNVRRLGGRAGER